ncbi:hypothetical protein B0H13DRAFT_2314944 [Mycena leptocephala]|nr:hypothetical protein B0H13DRAFT_2314944 [Mycena leptocephala]
MSSTTSTDTSLPSASSSLPTPPPNQLASGANYFFGFLIAFIAFLFVFLSLGLLARRRRMRLMRDFMLYGPDDSDLPNILQTEPVMWEPLYAEAKASYGAKLWCPLSTSLVRREVLDDKTPAEVPPPRPSRNPFVVYFGFPPSKPDGRAPTEFWLQRR